MEPNEMHSAADIPPAGMTPPHEPLAFAENESPRSRWPTVIGVIAIALASIGLVCGACGLAGGVMTALMSGATNTQTPPPQVPPALQLIQSLGVIMLFALSIVHLIGGIGLVRRRAWSRPVLLTWSILKIVTTVGSAVVGVLYAAESAQAWNHQMMQGQPPGGTPPFQFTETMVIQLTYATLVWFLIWPTFLLIWFSRRKIRDEVAQWGETAPV